MKKVELELKLKETEERLKKLEKAAFISARCAKCSEFLIENKQVRDIKIKEGDDVFVFKFPGYKCWDCDEISFTGENIEELQKAFDIEYEKQFPDRVIKKND